MKKLPDPSSSNKPLPAVDSVLANNQPLPKEYDAALKRVAQVLENQAPSTSCEKLLFGLGIFLSALLLIAQLLHWLSYPTWLELLYSFAIFVEASVPLVISFFLKNKQQTLILRAVGTVVLILYALSLFS
jgi:hypothetical protein